MESPKDHKIHCILRFGFQASNNVAEYEVVLAGLQSAKELEVAEINIYSDSQLVICQIFGKYQTHEEKMATYCNKVKEFLESFDSYTIQQIPRLQNTYANAFTELVSTKSADLVDVVSVKFLASPSITVVQEDISQVQKSSSWQDPILENINNNKLLNDK